MAANEELDCVSCESTFDAGPNGGFCPDCDTPHPDYEMPTTDDADEGPSDSGEKAAERDEQPGEADDQSPEADEHLTDPESDDSEADAEAAVETADPELVEDSIDDQCSSCGTAVDPAASFCSNCGSELETESETEMETEADELTECPNCSNSVSDESFCPNCGTDLDAVRAEEGSDDGDAEAVDDGGDETIDTDDDGVVDDGDVDDAEADETEDGEDEVGEEDDGDEAEEDDEGDETPDSVTLVIAGESYSLGDGDTFGRQDEIWLDDLVAASGGRDEASYISGEHLEFEIAEDGVYLTDLSTNGTSHNGEPLDGGRTRLEDGDTLELAGRAEITVEL